MPDIQIRFSPKLIAELDGLAEAAEVTRSETIRMLLRSAIDALALGEEEIEEEPTTCNECDAGIPGDAKFCPQCGTEFDEEESEDETEDEEK